MIRGNVYLSYYAKADKIQNCYKVAISKWLPSFIIKANKIYETKESKVYAHLPLFSPGDNVDKYKNGEISFEQLISEFEMYIQDKINNKDKVFMSVLDNLIKILDSGENIVFVCYEKDTNECHRKIIGDLFVKFGYNVNEF